MNDPSQNQAPQSNNINNNIPNNQPDVYPNQIPTTSSDDLFPPGSPGSTVHAMIGGRLITTTLGMLLLVIGLAAGVMLVRQPQLLEQKAQTVSRDDCNGKPKCTVVFDEISDISGYCDGNGNKISINPPYKLCTNNDQPRQCSDCMSGNCTQECTERPINECPNISRVWSECTDIIIPK